MYNENLLNDFEQNWMRGGDIGLGGRGIGAGLAEARQSYASDVAVLFDEIRGVYTGEMTSRGGLYRVEGPNATSIYNQMENLLYNEYREMMLEMEQQKKRNFGSGLENNQITIDGQPAEITKYVEEGKPVMTILADAKSAGVGVMNVIKTYEFTSMVMSFIRGDYFSAAFSAAALMFEDYLGGSRKKKKVFAVMFGGILITATSRAALKKLLTLHKNRRIQRIMNHIREHGRDERKRAEDNLSWELTKNIRKKKLVARASWNDSVMKQGGDWRERLRDRELLSERIKNKRETARALWTERMIG